MAEEESIKLPILINIIALILVASAIASVIYVAFLEDFSRIVEDFGPFAHITAFIVAGFYLFAAFCLFKRKKTGLNIAIAMKVLAVFVAVMNINDYVSGTLSETYFLLTSLFLPMDLFVIGYLIYKRNLFYPGVKYEIVEEPEEGKPSRKHEVSYVEKERREIITKERVPMFLLDEIPDKCPKCGAPYKKKTEGTCSHCGAQIKMKKKKI